MKATFKEPKWSGNEIVFLLQSEKNIDAEVKESYDFRSSIQETIAEIGSLMTESQRKATQNLEVRLLEKDLFTENYRGFNYRNPQEILLNGLHFGTRFIQL